MAGQNSFNSTPTEEMIMETLANVHPGEISAIFKGERGITADTALRLSLYFWNFSQILVRATR